MAEEIASGPLAAWRRPFGIAVENHANFGRGRVLLLLRPHRWRVALVIPHGVAEEGIEEDVGLVHVAIHALRGGDRAGEDMPQWMAAFFCRPLVLMISRLPESAMAIIMLKLARDGRIGGDRLPVAPKLCIAQRMARLAVVGIDDMASGAARMAVIARL